MNERLNIALTAALVLCALSLVKSQYQARLLFIDLGRTHAEARQLDIDWAQLQLDQSTLGKHARIDTVARRELNMVPVAPDHIEYLAPEAK